MTNPDIETGRGRQPDVAVNENRIARVNLIDDLRIGCKKMEAVVEEIINNNTFTPAPQKPIS